MGDSLSFINEDAGLTCLAQEFVLLAVEHRGQKHIPVGCKCSVRLVEFYSELRDVCVKT